MGVVDRFTAAAKEQGLDPNSPFVRELVLVALYRLHRSGPGSASRCTLAPGAGRGATALTELRLIDEYELVVHPRLAGHGPTLFGGLSKHLDLKLVSRLEYGSGAVAMRYEPTR